MEQNIVTQRIPCLVPSTAEEFFHDRGTIYQCIDVIWDAMQTRAEVLNAVLQIINDQLAANDIAAVEAENCGKTALALATKAADEVANLAEVHINEVDKKIAEINATKILLHRSLKQANEQIAYIQQLIKCGGLRGKDGRDGRDGAPGADGKTPVKGVDYFDGRDGRDGINGTNGLNGKDGVDGRDGRDGANGKSAYELWLEQGNTGSITDFLNNAVSPDVIKDQVNLLIESAMSIFSSSLEERIKTIEDNVVYHDTDSTEVPDVDINQTLINAISDLTNRISSLEYTINSNNSQIESIKNELNYLKENVVFKGDDVGDADDNVSNSHREKIAELERRMTEQETVNANQQVQINNNTIVNESQQNVIDDIEEATEQDLDNMFT